MQLDVKLLIDNKNIFNILDKYFIDWIYFIFKVFLIKKKQPKSYIL